MQYVYFVKSGEFKLYKNIQVVENKDAHVINILKKHKEHVEKGSKILDPYKL